MGQRRFTGRKKNNFEFRFLLALKAYRSLVSLAFQRPAEVDHNLGSPIISLAEGIVNFGPPIPLRESIVGNANLDSTLDNSNNRTRGE
jgi:hypothetical protein